VVLLAVSPGSCWLLLPAQVWLSLSGEQQQKRRRLMLATHLMLNDMGLLGDTSLCVVLD